MSYDHALVQAWAGMDPRGSMPERGKILKFLLASYIGKIGIISRGLLAWWELPRYPKLHQKPPNPN